MAYSKIVPQTIEELVEHYDAFISASIVKVSRGHVRSEDLPDLKQAVYARVLEKGSLGKYNPAKGAFTTYLYWILRSVVVNQFDHNTRNPLNMARGISTCPQPSEWEKGRVFLDMLQQDTRWEQRQVAADLLRRLEAHTDRVRNGAELAELLRLMYEGHSSAEAASALGRTQTTLSTYRKQLRALLGSLRATA